MDKMKIIDVYNYAKQHVKYIERDPVKQEDLVHDSILKLLMHPNLNDMEFPKAYVVKVMRSKYLRLFNNPRALEMPHVYLEAGEGVSYKALNYAGAQAQDVESYMDACTILDYVRAGKLTRSNNKGSLAAVFERYIQGYTHPEIAEELGICEGNSVHALSVARKRIKAIFKD